VADYARACGEAEREPDWGLVEAVRRGLGLTEVSLSGPVADGRPSPTGGGGGG